MEILIISGLSGAGKSCAAAILEDMNYYCIDNMPVELMQIFATLCRETEGSKYDKIAIVSDVRGGISFDKLFEAIDNIELMGYDCKILFVEASDDVIAKRYKETRRRHPLDRDGGKLTESIKAERQMLRPVREKADYVIDTTGMTLSRLGQRLNSIFYGGDDLKRFNVAVESFGYKYGIPIDADIVMDVRFLLNPYYVNELRDKTGLDKGVSDYVFSDKRTDALVEKMTDMLAFLLPGYIEEGKTSLVVCIGCTGGRHRSVAVAEAVADKLEELKYHVERIHRDIEK